jgi:hypothetical protein
MAAYKIKKSARLRKRFIQSEALDKLEDWLDVSEKLKNQIKTDSTFQLVGDKTVVSINSVTQIGHVLVEVLGIPKVGLKHIDQEPCEFLLYSCPESAFDIDFETIKARAIDLMGVITHRLEDSFHIVSDGLNLELHFFIQKDYIHS